MNIWNYENKANKIIRIIKWQKIIVLKILKSKSYEYIYKLFKYYIKMKYRL